MPLPWEVPKVCRHQIHHKSAAGCGNIAGPGSILGKLYRVDCWREGTRRAREARSSLERNIAVNFAEAFGGVIIRRFRAKDVHASHGTGRDRLKGK